MTVITRCLLLAWLGAGSTWAMAGVDFATDQSVTFSEIYGLLTRHCGACHVQGVADGPWSLNRLPGADYFPQCLDRADDEARRICVTYHQLVNEPGPGIPAWIRPGDAASEPYAQACDTSVSFHIGHSIPTVLAIDECDRFLAWIHSGAPEN